MPNTVKNTITVMGDPHHVARVREAIHDEKMIFSFGKLLDLYNATQPPDEQSPVDEAIRSKLCCSARPLSRGSISLQTPGVITYEIETAWVYPIGEVGALARIFPVQVVMSSTAWEWTEPDGTTPVYLHYLRDGELCRQWTEYDRWEMVEPPRWKAIWRKLRFPKPNTPIAEKPKVDDDDDSPY